ncbi:kinase-like protein [Ceratobasidium sp. AG-I]|nr:kinase-like protein [Ceratobasidium sp. AG-I]
MAPAQYNNDHLRYSEAPQSNALLSRAASTSTILSTPVSHVPISGVMLTTEVITHLRDHGCQDITKHLDNDSCTAHPISHGGFGDVYLGKLLDGSQVAIKTMRIHVNTDEAQKPLKHAARELYTWSKCQHPNVLGLLGLVEFRNQIGMVSHWMQNGSLLSYLEKQPETDRCRMSAEICKGLVYLHAEKIVHGDLKGPNVLISNDGTPMLTDFGNAILQESTLRFTATTTKYALSARWAAPELMEGLGMHSFAADVYALGMTILETITGKVPYSEKPELGVYMALVKRELPQQPEDFIPPNSENGKELWELLTSCWAHEWEDRPSAAHVADVVSTLSPKGLKKQASVKSNMHGFDPPGSDDRGSLPINNLSPELLVIPPRLTGDNLDTMEDMNIDSRGRRRGNLTERI